LQEELFRIFVLRIVYLGTPAASAFLLEELLEGGFSVEAVVTRPDLPKGRGLKTAPPPVKLTALRHSIVVYQPEKVTPAFFETIVEKHSPDIGLVFAFGAILPEAVLRLLPFGFLNVHLSLLPRWRGAAPVVWTILAGDEVAGVTVQKVAPRLDTGEVLASERVPLSGKETAGELTRRLTGVAVGVVCSVLRAYERGEEPEGVAQDESRATYAPKITKEKAKIDWSRSAVEIERAVRAFNPSPAAHSRLILPRKSITVRLFRAEVTSTRGIPAGRVVASKTGVLVGTKDYALKILEIQPEGRRRMSGVEFRAGYLKKGEEAHFETE